MRTILKKTITLETKRYDFDNEFAYIEVWANNLLKDNYFAEKDFLFPDGTVKKDGRKYFYSPLWGSDIEKEIKPVKVEKFKWFDRLFYFNEEGEILRIDGVCSLDIEPEFKDED
jgi:hypothetical protein